MAQEYGQLRREIRRHVTETNSLQNDALRHLDDGEVGKAYEALEKAQGEAFDAKQLLLPTVAGVKS